MHYHFTAQPFGRPAARLHSPVFSAATCRYYATQYVLTHFRWLWRFIASVPFLRKYADRFVIESVAKQLQFPLALSTAANYTGMNSFTDHSYFNRVLPERQPSSPLPRLEEVRDLLFKRPIAGYQQDDYSNFLFLSFAQWFVDQFLMSDPSNPVKQYSQNVINLCTVYGDTAEVEALLRADSGGRLKSQRIRGEEFPPSITEKTKPLLISADLERLIAQAMGATPASGKRLDWTKLFAIGHPRMNLTPGCLTFALIWFREHNRLADLIQQQHPSWDNDRVFQTAKNVCIVEVLKVGTEDYIVNHIAYKLQYPLRFHPETLWHTEWYYNNQRIFLEFCHLYRWHAFVPNAVTIAGSPVPLKNDSGEQLLWNTDFFIDGRSTLSSLIHDMSNAPAGRFGPLNTHPALADIDMRTVDAGRRAKLASFNDYRERFGLWRYRSIDELTSSPTVRQRLAQLYNGRVDDVEFYVGLMCEERGYGNSIFPPLLAAIVGAEAFRGVFGNPLLAPAVYNAETFTQLGLDVIEGTTLKTLVARNLAPGSRRPEHRVSFELPGKRGAAADR